MHKKVYRLRADDGSQFAVCRRGKAGAHTHFLSQLPLPLLVWAPVTYKKPDRAILRDIVTQHVGLRAAPTLSRQTINVPQIGEVLPLTLPLAGA